MTTATQPTRVAGLEQSEALPGRTSMGIKMSQARDQNGHFWDAETYQKGLGAEPLAVGINLCWC